MSLKDAEDMTPRSLINPKSISAAIEYFFGRGELSQVVDQTNPLAQLTHETATLGSRPGRLESQAGGLRSARRAHFALWPHLPNRNARRHEHRLDLVARHLRRGGRVRLPGHALSRDFARKADREGRDDARDEESEAYLAPADAPADDHGKLKGPHVIARYQTDFHTVPVEQVQYVDISPKQMVGVSAGLIPFLEHDDANRALMGSNMQRQAVPLLVAEPPIVATGLGKGRRDEFGHDREGPAERDRHATWTRRAW